MSPREWRFRIADILESVQAVQEYTTGMDYDRFRDDRRTFDAVIRRPAIIGEAASHIPNEVMALAPDVDWRHIRGMRNVLVHEYFGIDRRIIWDMVQADAPALIEPLKKLLESGTD